MSEVLKEITYLTLKELKQNDIVLPGEYSKEFSKHATGLEFDLKDDDVVLRDLNRDMDKINFVVKQTNENIINLKDSTVSAKKAIEEKNTKSLETITSDLVKMQEQISFLEKELFSDSLTKAYNRKWFSDYYLTDEKFPEDGYLAFIDLDKFKRINDEYGHITGDQVLKFLVKFLKKELDYEGVKVIRYAGDEFMAIFSKEEMPSLNIQTIMKDAQDKLSKLKLKSEKVDALSFGFSYGIVEFKRFDELAQIIEKADELMYQNKKR